MLTDKEIQHIAKLARIKLTPGEEGRFKNELSSVLDYVKQLDKLDTNDIEPLYQTTGLINSTRPDQDRGEFKMDENLNEKLIDQAPQKEKRFIKVKSVLKND